MEEINIILDKIKQAITLPFDYFIDNEHRVFLPYIVTSLLLAYFVFLLSDKKTTFFTFVFGNKRLINKSAQVDYCLIFINAFFKVFLIANWVIWGSYLQVYIDEYLQLIFGYNRNSISVTSTLIFYTLSITFMKDFMAYLVHFLFHKIPFLWEFHKTHHSATTLTPLTQYRIHPVELIINNISMIFVFGLITGVFDYLSKHQIHQITYYGVNVFTFFFLASGANLRHSHVKLKYPSLIENIFISPFQHQIHHSDNSAHFNKNLGSKLAIWDYLFGTLLKSKQVEDINFGIDKNDKEYGKSILKNLFSPFIKLLKRSR